ncbi:MAG: tRNA (5-methylaminomethyl-2-thiouridine)(34)-methyltransferase MnmD [Bacteroidales bacterium]|jgi:tRNA U34 5-methylaminomethyl-2-thiouridine-forming methyltransferase MnmC|nr:tRNA (5-methylaminomethyl-2-thiouridine)(34)-methyltransferase MnmD [Bacteroidales bacterium]
MFITDDGSASLKSSHFGETYHSTFGAVDESMHVFIHAGLREWYRQNPKNHELHIFEMGFGTGLNAVLTLQWAETMQIHVIYHTIELFPLSHEQLNGLNHANFVNESLQEQVHNIQFGNFAHHVSAREISPYFSIIKQQISLLDIEPPNNYFDVIFFDAFSPNVQPELWTETVFQKVYNASRKNAILTTYCAKGDVRHAMKAAGFDVKKIPGPVGKREITRAKKI